MVRHVVMWRLHEQAEGRTKAQNAALAKTKLEGLVGRIPGLLRAEVGVNFSPEETALDIVLVSDFASREALEAYRTHPEHQAVVAFLGGVRSERRVVDYEV